MPRGGRREGAGRKGRPHASRSLRLPVELWEAVDTAADQDAVTSNAKAREWLETMAGAEGFGAETAAPASAPKRPRAGNRKEGE